MPLSPTLLRRLNDALIHRSITDGIQLLHNADKDFNRLNAADPYAPSYLLCLAQWVDLGYRDLTLFNDLIGRMSKVQRGQLPLSDYVNLKMAEAYRAFASADTQGAIPMLDFVLRIEPGIVDLHLIVLCHFWKARAHRSQGEYDLALEHIVAAKAMASRLKAPKLVAEVKIHESWLLFQRGQRKEALRLLDEAQAELQPTGHTLSLGNIESARGRFVRRSGEYAKALVHFERAVTIYSERFPVHPNTARALVNAAYVKRLIALNLKHRSNTGRAKAAHHAQYLTICQDALDLLDKAGEIYSYHHHQAGTGAVYVNAGYLHLDSGDIDRAEDEASKAFTLGEHKLDHILMARARTLQSALQNERAEEEVGESPDIALHAALAKTYSEEAVAIAKMTQNNRLLAGAYIAVSATAASDFFQDWETAKEFATLAGGLLAKDDRDHLWRELSQLKARILRATGIDEMLRSWSDGIVSNRTFQQVTEEFAEIVIPKVWLREGRRISKVAELLSMSPKKVRRILTKVNLSGHMQ
jgi:tetratricopeptide (TPR) repeat protein